MLSVVIWLKVITLSYAFCFPEYIFMKPSLQALTMLISWILLANHAQSPPTIDAQRGVRV
jgi:hypothetical protein